MTVDSPVLKVLLIVFAIIGLLAVLSVLGTLFMHGGMMGMMGCGTEGALEPNGRYVRHRTDQPELRPRQKIT